MTTLLAPSSSLGIRQAGVILIAVILATIFAQFAVEELLALHTWHSTSEAAGVRLALTGLISPWIGLAVIMSALRGYFKGDNFGALLVRFGFFGKVTNKAMIGAFLVGISVNLVFTALTKFPFAPPQATAPHPFNVLNHAPLLLVLGFGISASTIVPIFEEYLFRGVLFEGLSQRFNTVIAGIVVTLMFMALHYGNIATGYWFTHLYFLLISLLLITVRIFSGALYLPVLLHAGLNFSEFFLT